MRLKTAFTLFDNSVIRPKQNQVIEALDQILAFNNVSLEPVFQNTCSFRVHRS